MITKSDELLLKKYIRKEFNFVTDIDILDIDIEDVQRGSMLDGYAVCMFKLKNKENVHTYSNYVYFDGIYGFIEFKKKEREINLEKIFAD